MSSPFVKHSIEDNYWCVSWPHWPQQVFSIKNNRLMDIVFDTIKCDEAGILLKLYADNSDILWIDSYVYERDTEKTYSFYLEEQYEIIGVVFTAEKYASDFFDWLEKQFMWMILNE
jgi:hypothetical protein